MQSRLAAPPAGCNNAALSLDTQDLWRAAPLDRRHPHVHVVVMLGDHLDDAGRPGQARAGAHEHVGRTGADEAVDEVLRESPIDVGRRARGERSARG
jgi:hypothetical protein